MRWLFSCIYAGHISLLFIYRKLQKITNAEKILMHDFFFIFIYLFCSLLYRNMIFIIKVISFVFELFSNKIMTENSATANDGTNPIKCIFFCNWIRNNLLYFLTKQACLHLRELFFMQTNQKFTVEINLLWEQQLIASTCASTRQIPRSPV